MSKQSRHRPPLPFWLTIPGILLQGGGIFFLPFLVGLCAAMLFEVSEVVETLPALLGFTVVVLFPVSLAQLLGLALKSRREIKYWYNRGELGITRLLDVLYTHIRVVTLRGWTILLAGLVFTVMALGLKWASFGLMAVLGLFMFYIMVGWTVFISTFLVRTFEVGMGRSRSGIQRQMIPAVCKTGQLVEEVFTFRRVPVPWGYFLLVEDPLSPRLKTESRYSLGATSSAGETVSRGRLRATPRGHFFLGPARIWYQDLLGITRVSIASVATAELKVLPNFKPVTIIDPPRTSQSIPDIITKPSRYATEDYFRFREYSHGDDTRRIHWRLSMKTGRLQVRQPETKEISTQEVLLVLDTYLPPGKLLNSAIGADEILDSLVDAFLGIARELVSRGDKVTMLSAATGHEKDEVRIEMLPVRTGQSARSQDLGARAHWQGRYDLPELLEHAGDEVHGVVVTSRFTAPPPGEIPGKSTTWLFMDPADALGEPDPHWTMQLIGADKNPLRVLSFLFRLPHPVGSEDNAIYRRAINGWRIFSLYSARKALRSFASYRAGRTLGELSKRPDAIYRIERDARHIRLVGLKARTGE
ncbi:MAG: DUF58 domain-containing protein [Proteobacteria bacterium]|jgi:uncharacterized protein (DUF58 family)|nr:DUF58 domain-containing protein [Pseudomonadota bacterium]